MDYLERVISSLEELESVLQRNSHPGTNEAALGRVQALCSNMRGDDTYISEKAGQLRELAGMFYSARRHMKYPGGASRLYTDICYDLPSRIQGQVEHIQRCKAKADQ